MNKVAIFGLDGVTFEVRCMRWALQSMFEKRSVGNGRGRSANGSRTSITSEVRWKGAVAFSLTFKFVGTIFVAVNLFYLFNKGSGRLLRRELPPSCESLPLAL